MIASCALTLVNLQILLHPPLSLNLCSFVTALQPLVFWGWIFTALIESTFISALPLFTLANSDLKDGTLPTFLSAGMTAFTVIVLVVNLKLFFVQSKWYYTSYLVIGGSVGLYFATISFITSFKLLDFNFYQVCNYCCLSCLCVTVAPIWNFVSNCTSRRHVW